MVLLRDGTPLERCDKVLQIVAATVDDQTHDATLVQAGPVWFKSELCPECDKYMQHRGTWWEHLKTARRDAAEQYRARRLT